MFVANRRVRAPVDLGERLVPSVVKASTEHATSENQPRQTAAAIDRLRLSLILSVLQRLLRLSVILYLVSAADVSGLLLPHVSIQ